MPHYTITVADDHVDRIDEVADQLRSQGIEVESVLADLGLITVEADPSSARRVTALEGVESVAEGPNYQLPPPDAPIQ